MKTVRITLAMILIFAFALPTAALADDYEPMRENLEKFGAAVVWDASNQTVNFKLRNGENGYVTIGSDVYHLGNKAGKMDDKAAIIDGVASIHEDFLKLLKLENAGGTELESALQISEKLFTVQAKTETEAVESGEDAADDPSVWVHPQDPSKSEIIATNKGGGILVYDLDGKVRYSYAVGKVNNVDVRYQFPLGGKKVDIAAATNRTNNSVDFFAIDPDSGELTQVTGKPIPSKMIEVYGFSLYHSLKTGKFYALILGHEGEFEQWELHDNGLGQIEGKLVRQFQLGSISEGLVADDEYGYMYLAEENLGIWKYNAEPNSGVLPVSKVDSANGLRLTHDIEGLTLYYGADGTGYLLASSQGSDRYVIYERAGDNAYVSTFQVVDGQVDGTSETDGIDVLSFGLGDEYPDGLFLTQDDKNVTDGKEFNQNFKLVPWEKIAGQSPLELSVDRINPRELISRKK